LSFVSIEPTTSAPSFAFFASLDFREVGPGSGAKIAAQLEEDVRAGAVGIGEIQKSFGLFNTKADGTRLAIDDPELDIVWETAGRLGIPVFVHTADPAEFFQPLDHENERWLEMKAVWDACEKASLPIPHSVLGFFNHEAPDDRGVIVNLNKYDDRHECLTEWNERDGSTGFEVDLTLLPDDITILRFYNSW